MYRVTRGLDIQLGGSPRQEVAAAPSPIHIGLVADDYVGLKARFAVAEGDDVKRGQLVFEDRTVPGVRYTAPGAGRVVGLHRGERRSFRSLVIELTPGERSGHPEIAPLQSFERLRPSDLDGGRVRALLLESGLWTALRSRPFGRVADPAVTPRALLVNAMDSEPLAAAPAAVIAGAREDFQLGLLLLTRLVSGEVPVHLALAPGDDLGVEIPPAIRVERFAGPHPAGSVGYHVHRLCPVDRDRVVWTIGYQEVIALAELARTGVLPVERVIALGGPGMREPRLIRSRLGASVEETTRGEIVPDVRLVSGSALSGRQVADPAMAFVGRHHLQICALPVSTVDRRGGPVLPLARYERVFPYDFPAVFLLRALACGDVDTAEALGCLDLSEEDIALCSYVCPARNDFGSMLREVLERLRAEVEEAMDDRLD